jgi:hypothetical protein
VVDVANGTTKGLQLICTADYPFTIPYDKGFLPVKAGFLLCGMKLCTWIHPAISTDVSYTVNSHIVRGVSKFGDQSGLYYLECQSSYPRYVLNGILAGA